MELTVIIRAPVMSLRTVMLSPAGALPNIEPVVACALAAENAGHDEVAHDTDPNQNPGDATQDRAVPESVVHEMVPCFIHGARHELPRVWLGPAQHVWTMRRLPA
ncbi:MAG: hypothetical protein ABI178_15010 [Rhodanobacter sp.]